MYSCSRTRQLGFAARIRVAAAQETALAQRFRKACFIALDNKLAWGRAPTPLRLLHPLPGIVQGVGIVKIARHHLLRLVLVRQRGAERAD